MHMHRYLCIIFMLYEMYILVGGGRDELKVDILRLLRCLLFRLPLRVAAGCCCISSIDNNIFSDRSGNVAGCSWTDYTERKAHLHSDCDGDGTSHGATRISWTFYWPLTLTLSLSLPIYPAAVVETQWNSVRTRRCYDPKDHATLMVRCIFLETSVHPK